MSTAGILFGASTALLVVVFVTGLLMRRALADGRVLFATLLTVLLALVAVFSGIYAADGDKFVKSGGGALRNYLPIVERRLERHSQETNDSGTFHVVVFGDSTHTSRGPQRLMMNGALQALQRARGIDGVHVEGINWAGFGPYDYYFLMNLLAQSPPDLVVIPLNLRAFGNRWYREGGNYYPVLERYECWTEIPRAVRLSSSLRPVSAIGILLRKLDYRLADSRIGAFINGIRIALDDRLSRPSTQTDSPTEDDEAPSPRRKLLKASDLFTQDIDNAHPVLAALEEINQFAARNGIGVLYYTVQTPDLRARASWNFDVLRFELTRSPDVRFVDLQGFLQRDDFQLGEHLYDDGFVRIANRLIDEIVEAKDDAAWRVRVVERAEHTR